MRDYHFTPESYLAMMREAVPGYDQMEDETVAATGAGAKSVLELGIGTGETARRVLARHPEATLIGIDGSPGMVAVARDTLPAHRVSVLVGRLEDPLPEGPFDLVVSALAVHHLPADSKADLFRRIANALEPGGRFVLADVVTPLNPSYVVTAIDPEVDYPSTLDEQLAWLDAAGISPEVTWTHRDLVVIIGTARTSAPRPPERGGHTPRVGGRCESDPPGPDPEGTSLRTARLRLLPLTSRDESDHARASRNAADALRDTRAADVQWREHGFGPWAVRDKQGSCFLGCAELRLAGDGIEGIAPDEVEAGWWVTEDRRNDGIATEAMEAAIDDLFSRTDVETITAYISDGGNEASRRVAAKLGFSVRGRGHGRSGEPMTVYTLPRDDWLRQRP
jgi:tRNA (cmo5U34)-methyltransferase